MWRAAACVLGLCLTHKSVCHLQAGRSVSLSCAGRYYGGSVRRSGMCLACVSRINQFVTCRQVGFSGDAACVLWLVPYVQAILSHTVLSGAAAYALSVSLLLGV